MFRQIGAPEIILILVVLVLLFGAKRLPDVSRSLGRSMRIFKSEVKQMKDDDGADVPGDTRADTRPEPRPDPRPIEGTVHRDEREAPRQAVPEADRRDV
jgi:sec-independent protein translocase protein TatA